jgi:putative transposase
MTRSRYRIFETEYPYILTCTIVGWLPVFTRPEAVQILFDCWAFLRQNRGFKLYGYVVLENHLHLIASAPDLSNAMKSFKMDTARQVIELLTRHGAEMLLRHLRAHKLRHKTKSEYQVWQEGSHPKQVGNDEMMRQKLEYLHNNPVKRGYVDDPVHWRYSNARNYAGLPGLVEVVTDWA